jgi:hypothetical protein
MLPAEVYIVEAGPTSERALQQSYSWLCIDNILLSRHQKTCTPHDRFAFFDLPGILRGPEESQTTYKKT